LREKLGTLDGGDMGKGERGIIRQLRAVKLNEGCNGLKPLHPFNIFLVSN
jgi:hypothetical protein